MEDAEETLQIPPRLQDQVFDAMEQDEEEEKGKDRENELARSLALTRTFSSFYSIHSILLLLSFLIHPS